MDNFEERREYKRYRSKDDQLAYVAIRLNNTFRHIGTVKDVSLGGLGCHYNLMGDNKPLSEEEAPVSTDLFVSNNRFYLPSLKCRLAYDKAAEKQPLFPIDTQFRECGVAFDVDELTAKQKENLQFFFEDYMAGEA